MSVRIQELINSMERNKENAKHKFSMNAVSVIGAADRAADGFPDAESTIIKGQSGMQEAIDTILRGNNVMKSQIDKITRDTVNLSAQLTESKASLSKLKKEVENDRVIDITRREQVQSLHNRENSNYYSSYLGLSRPLKDTSQIGILVVSIGLFLISIACFYYAYSIGLFARQYSQTPDFFKYFSVGGMKK